MTTRSTVVQCHPVPDSFNAALGAALIEGLTATEPEAPAVHRIAMGDVVPDELAGHLYLVFPTWWGGLPSPLLGLIQERLGPWVDEGRRGPSPWAGVTRLHCLTTYGSPKANNRLQGEPGRRLVERTVASLCAPGVEVAWRAIYGLDGVGDDHLGRQLDALRRDPLAVIG